MNSARNNIAHTLQIVVLLLIAPLLFGAWGFYYVSRLDTVMSEQIKRNLSSAAIQSAEIIEVRLANRLTLLDNIVAQPLMRDSDASLQSKLDFLREEVARRGLVRMGLASLDGKGMTTDGYSLDVADRKYFAKARSGTSCISEILICKILNIPIVVHTTPVRDRHGKVTHVLFATERVDILRSLLHSNVAYKNTGENILADRNGVLLDANAMSLNNFYQELALQNGMKDSMAMRAALGDPEKSMHSYMVTGVRSFIHVADVMGGDGWQLILTVPEAIASAEVDAILRITLGTMCLIILLLLGCGIYILSLRRGYLKHRDIARAALQTSGIYHVLLNSTLTIVQANEPLAKRLGWHDDGRGRCFNSLIYDAPNVQLTKHLQESESFMLCHMAENGDHIHVQWHILPAPGHGQYSLLGTDLSARLQAVESQHAQASMRDFQQIFDNIPAPMALRDRHNRLRLANRTLLDLVGENIEELTHKRFGGLVPDDETALLDNAFDEVVRQGVSVSVRHTIRDAEGNVRHYRNTQAPLLSEEGEVTSVVSLSVDITDSLKVEEHLKQELQRLRDLLDTSPVGVVISINGLVSFCNLRARQMVGLEVGKPVHKEGLIVEGDPDVILSKLSIMPIVRDVPIVVRDPRKRLRHLLITASRACLEGQQAYIIWAMDVTPLKEVEKQLIHARDGAEQATRAKSDFLATMSHEIRTPMNAVLGFLHLFERNNLSQHQLDYLDKISISATGLLRIINDILDFSKIEAGKLIMEQLTFNLSACLDAVHSIIGFSAKEKGLELSMHIASDVPEYVVGDRERLNQVIINLLNNAVKFTTAGFVRLEVNVREKRPDGSILLGFTVIDSGIGMSPEHISRVFQPFSQADTSVSRRFGGTGLGLVISRRLVELMGGRISVTSEEGRGATFDFTICCYIESNDTQQLTMVNDLDIAEKMRAIMGAPLLVVEDNEINQEIAGAMLTQLGMEVDFACDGQVALEKVAANDYALIFMDMQMPVMDGLEATRRIRAMAYTRPILKTIPIIAMTANAMLDDRRRCLEVGMNAHIAKPIEPESLRKVLIQWIKV